MLLCLSSCYGKILGVDFRAGQGLVEFAGNVALEAADDFLCGQSFGGATRYVGAGVGVVAHAGYDDHVEGAVGLPVAAAVEAVAFGLAAGGGYRGYPAQRGEGCLGVQPVGVVATGGQQLGGGFHADTSHGQQVGSGLFDQGSELGVGVGDFGGECLVASGQAA